MSEGKLFLIAIKNASEHANPFVRAAAVVARLIYKSPCHLQAKIKIILKIQMISEYNKSKLY